MTSSSFRIFIHISSLKLFEFYSTSLRFLGTMWWILEASISGQIGIVITFWQNLWYLARNWSKRRGVGGKTELPLLMAFIGPSEVHATSGAT